MVEVVVSIWVSWCVPCPGDGWCCRMMITGCDAELVLATALSNLMRTQLDWILYRQPLTQIRSLCWRNTQKVVRKHVKIVKILLVKEFWQIYCFLCAHPFFSKLHSALLWVVIKYLDLVTEWSNRWSQPSLSPSSQPSQLTSHNNSDALQSLKYVTCLQRNENISKLQAIQERPTFI